MSEAAALPLNNDPLGPPERLHPLYLITGIAKSLKGAWGMLAAVAVLGASAQTKSGSTAASCREPAGPFPSTA